MRIGILTHNYPKTSTDRKDAGIFLYDFAQELSKKAEVYVLAPNFSGEKEDYKKVPVTWFDWAGGDTKLGNWSLFNPKALLNFLSLLRKGNDATVNFVNKNKIDFLLACWALPSGVFASYAKTKVGVPYATWSLGSDINSYAKIPILKGLIKSALRNANIRFANSYLLADEVSKLSGKKGDFLPAISNFTTTAIKPMKLDNNKFNFLFVGRLEKVKGPDILIEACKILKEDFENFNLYIIGPGSMETLLKEEVSKGNLTGNINFLGRQGAKEIAAYMLGADCLVIPSRSESLPLVLIEAAKSSLPIIASNVGDCQLVVSKYNIGQVVEKDSISDLSRAMLEASKKGKSYRGRYKKGLMRVSEDFVLSKSVDLLIQKIKV